jgi:hypothetical protein
MKQRGESNSKAGDWGRRAFSPKTKRVLAAIVEAMFSDEDEVGLRPAPAALTERVVDEFDLLIGAGSGDLGRGFRILSFIVEWIPIFIIGVFSRASRLPLGRRVSYLHKLEHAKIALVATLLVAFKLPLTMLVYEQQPDLRATGFDRETVSTRRLPGPSLKVIGE